MARWATPCALLLAGVATLAQSHVLTAAAAGLREEIDASTCGFDPGDATAALQKAIDSGARRVIVPNVGKPWIVRRIFLRSDQQIHFAKGVEIVAKPGAFPGVHDALVTAENGSNIALIGPGATFRMQKKEYTQGEWRHALSLRGCRNVKVVGLTLRDSGGDGIYLGHGVGKDGPAICENVQIRGVTCENNRRQGISVITARNLVIEDCVLSNTNGTAPQAGIDFEPNGKDEQLAGCVLRNCRIEGNRGHGVHAYLKYLDATSEPVSIRVENCRIAGNGQSALSVAGARKDGPKGLIEFVGCQVAYGPVDGGLTISRKAPESVGVRFAGCRWRLDPSRGSGDEKARQRSALLLAAGSTREPWPTGGIEFVGCSVEDPRDLPVLDALVPKGLAEALKDVRGTIEVKGPAGARLVGGTAAGLDLKITAPAE